MFIEGRFVFFFWNYPEKSFIFSNLVFITDQNYIIINDEFFLSNVFVVVLNL